MKIKNLLAPIVLATTLACNGPTTPNPPQPNPECVTGTAVQYAQDKGLDVNVRVYDDNDDSRGGCFTIHERALIDRLHDLKVNKGIEESVLQEIVDDHPTVGPLTVSALRDHAIGWEHDQAFAETPFYSGTLDYILAHEMVPTMLMPGLQANPSVSGHAVKHSFPVNEDVYHWLPPRLNNMEDVDSIPSENFLSRMGYDECRQATPEQYVGSLDIATPDFTINPVHVAWPEPVRLINLIATQRNDYGINYNEFTFGFQYNVDADDRPLLDVDEVVLIAGHMFPQEIASPATREDYLEAYGFSMNGLVEPYTHIGYNNNVTKIVDISYETPSAIPGAARNLTGHYVFDLLGAPFSNNASNMGIRFAESRFSNITIHTPCDRDSESGDWINLP